MRHKHRLPPFNKIWGPHVKYSDQIANGNAADDKELEDEDDLADPIVDDNGFVNKWKIDKAHVKEWGRRKDIHQNHSLVQHKLKSKAKGKAPLWGPDVKYSDQIANGDADDDKELEDSEDPDDDIVTDNGFVNHWKINPEKLKEYARRHPQHKTGSRAQKSTKPHKHTQLAKGHKHAEIMEEMNEDAQEQMEQQQESQVQF